MPSEGHKKVDLILRFVEYSDGALMENIIMSNMNSTMVVKVSRSAGGLRSTHVSQEPTKPEEFGGGIGKSTVLSFSTDCFLLRLEIREEPSKKQ